MQTELISKITNEKKGQALGYTQMYPKYFSHCDLQPSLH